MAAFYLKIGNDLSLMVIPETRVYMDGHPILTHSYSIYHDADDIDFETTMSADEQKKQSNPNYMGYITFEIPGKVFHYVSDGGQTLSREELEQIVEGITHYRDNPDLWKAGNN